MPFIPHTDRDIETMLSTIGVGSINELFDEIPPHLRARPLNGIADGLSEMAMLRLMSERAAQDAGNACFIGAGAYEHHIPAAVWDITTRGEFMTAYTPYQAEASQGTLQLVYEFQSMMCQLTGLDVSNASLYDGASGLSEAVLMAVRANRKSKSKRVLIAASLHPHYLQAVESIVGHQQITVDQVALTAQGETVDMAALNAYAGQDYAALVIPQPNFFGRLEAVHELTDWAHANGMLVIAVVNPTALALLSAPGEWGQQGADMAVGEGQPLGLPLASGGPYFGFLTCKEALVRQMPGRIIGRTVDLEGKQGFTLTLQAREQHIRRSKATSNICTNQGLAVTAATIYLSLLGFDGLQQVARNSHRNTQRLIALLQDVPGVKIDQSSAHFHEFVLHLPVAAAPVLARMAEQGVLGGLALAPYFPDRDKQILVCVTETKTDADLQRYVAVLNQALAGGK